LVGFYWACPSKDAAGHRLSFVTDSGQNVHDEQLGGRSSLAQRTCLRVQQVPAARRHVSRLANILHG